MSTSSAPNSNHDDVDQETLSNRLLQARELLVDALRAGRYVEPEHGLRKHHNGYLLEFSDRTIGAPRTGIMVVAEEITPDILKDAISSEAQSYVIIGGWLADDADLGGARSARIQFVDEMEHYWAAYVIDGSVMVSVGTPPSSCRLIGEVLNLQMPQPFVQRRICIDCHTLNDYYSLHCTECGATLTATGRLG